MSDDFVGILNLDMGNLRSVSNAITSLGHDCGLVAAPEQLEHVTHLVIPGVGSFHTAMRRVTERGLRDPVRRFADSGRPVLGLCLGMQLLGSRGDEGEASRGLDLWGRRSTASGLRPSWAGVISSGFSSIRRRVRPADCA